MVSKWCQAAYTPNNLTTKIGQPGHSQRAKTQARESMKNAVTAH